MSKFSALRQNITATNGLLQNKSRMATSKQLCWRCQKDKPLLGGNITMLGGNIPGAVRKFICMDCRGEMRAKREGGAA